MNYRIRVKLKPGEVDLLNIRFVIESFVHTIICVQLKLNDILSLHTKKVYYIIVKLSAISENIIMQNKIR